MCSEFREELESYTGDWGSNQTRKTVHFSRNGNNRAAIVTFFAGPPRFANFLWNTAVVASPPAHTSHCSTFHLKASHTEGSTHQARLSLPPLHSSLFSQHIGCCPPISNKKQDHQHPQTRMMSRSNSVIFVAVVAGLLGHSTEALRVLTPSEGMTVVADR